MTNMSTLIFRFKRRKIINNAEILDLLSTFNKDKKRIIKNVKVCSLLINFILFTPFILDVCTTKIISAVCRFIEHCNAIKLKNKL
jgi:hypothetical protein